MWSRLTILSKPLQKLPEGLPDVGAQLLLWSAQLSDASPPAQEAGYKLKTCPCDSILEPCNYPVLGNIYRLPGLSVHGRGIWGQLTFLRQHPRQDGEQCILRSPAIYSCSVCLSALCWKGGLLHCFLVRSFMYCAWKLPTWSKRAIAMQSYSKRVANAKSDKYHQNIHKRGKVFEGKEVSGNSHPSHHGPMSSFQASLCCEDTYG